MTVEFESLSPEDRSVCIWVMGASHCPASSAAYFASQGLCRTQRLVAHCAPARFSGGHDPVDQTIGVGEGGEPSLSQILFDTWEPAKLVV